MTTYKICGDCKNFVLLEGKLGKCKRIKFFKIGVGMTLTFLFAVIGRERLANYLKARWKNEKKEK